MTIELKNRMHQLAGRNAEAEQIISRLVESTTPTNLQKEGNDIVNYMKSVGLYGDRVCKLYNGACAENLENLQTLLDATYHGLLQVRALHAITYKGSMRQSFPYLKSQISDIVALNQLRRIEENAENVPAFHYCSYWGNWSRVLTAQHPEGPYVEVNLTPISHSYDSTWESDIAPIRIRKHGTGRKYGRFEKDKLTTELPPHVREAMVKSLGEELTHRILTEDFLSQIDWDLYKQHCNGGANLADIRRN